MDAWERIKQYLAGHISSEAYQNWLEQTKLQTVDKDTLWVSVPDSAAAEWLEGEYGSQVTAALQHLGLPYTRVSYRPLQAPSNGSTGPAHAPLDLLFEPTYAQLNPKFSFDTFVVGPCNQFAHAAALAVAKMPSRSYNPLFVYGGVGMGKTHLMHAIGRHLLENFAGMRIVYTSSERFMNQMIECIKTDRLRLFHQHYRSADVLLVDDIHILGGKERTQEEFFHTFNSLYDHQKQIVISSDSPPKDIPGLVERLRSRFQWGLMVDVQPPDLETKMAILDKKAEAEGFHLPEDVRIYIATHAKSNVRELEGALIRLIAHHSVIRTPITLSVAQQALRQFFHSTDRKITIDAVTRAVAERYSLQPAQLKHKTNAHHISFPRQVAMFLVKELTNASLPEIGRAFGGKHHTTVLHSVQKIERLRHTDPDLNRVINSIIDSFQT